MRRTFTIVVLLLIFAMLGVVVWVSNQLGTIKHKAAPVRPDQPAVHSVEQR